QPPPDRRQRHSFGDDALGVEEVFEVSAKTGQGMERWLDYLRTQAAASVSSWRLSVAPARVGVELELPGDVRDTLLPLDDRQEHVAVEVSLTQDGKQIIPPAAVDEVLEPHADQPVDLEDDGEDEEIEPDAAHPLSHVLTHPRVPPAQVQAEAERPGAQEQHVGQVAARFRQLGVDAEHAPAQPGMPVPA